MAVSLLRNIRTGASRPYLSLPNLSAPVSVFSGASVPGRLKIAASEPETGFAFQPPPDAELPRRVQAGEAIASDPAGFPLLAPVPGIIDYDAASGVFTLKTEGAVRFGVSDPGAESGDGPLADLNQLSDPGELRQRFLESLRESGVPSLEFRGISLSAFFEQALKAVSPRVVIARRDGEGGIDWTRYFAAREAQLKALVEFLTRLHPQLSCQVAPRGSSGPEYYGETLPEVLIDRVGAKARHSKLEPTRSLAEQGVVFLGPATLVALLDWLFEGRSFTDRLTVLRDANGKHSQLFRLINGYDLQLLFQEKLPEGQRSSQKPRLVVKGNLIQNPPAVLDRESPRHQNIFAPVSLHILSRDPHPTRAAALPCTACMACQQACPVDARPFSLLEKHRVQEFRADRCLECGLCDFVCESGIPLSATIAELRAAAQLPARNVC